MRTLQSRLPGVALAAIAVALLSVPTAAMAQTDQRAPRKHVATASAKKHQPTHWRYPYARRNLYGWDRRAAEGGGCTNQFPPCMSTFPEGSPDYHGPRLGVTFGND